MYSNGKFVNNCKSVGPTMIRQHSLSPSRWPMPHLSFSFLFFFPFILHLQISSHLSSPYLIILSQRKSQTQTSNPVFFIKENPTSPIRKTKIHISSSLSSSFFFFLSSFFFFSFSWVWMTASLAIFLNLGLHTTAKGLFILYYFLDLDDSFNINFSGFFLLLLSFLDNWLANPNCIAIRFNFLRWFNFFLYFPICKRGWIWFCGWLVWVFAVLLLGFLCGWFLHLYREEQGRKEKREGEGLSQ